MNFNEAMQMLGTKLQGKYGHLGFKYKKSDKTLTRHSKNFTYMIAFSSFGGNTKDSISIEVCYIINTRPYDPYGYAKPDINTQPLFYSLRDNEIYLDIGNEEKINLTIHGERYCVLGEFWKEADGDQLLLRPGEETIWYYAHEQDKVKRLCNDMAELLEKKLARYLNEH